LSTSVGMALRCAAQPVCGAVWRRGLCVGRRSDADSRCRPQELAAATGAPALAGWISESSCLYLVGATPEGRSWSAHLPDVGKRGCGFDHHRFALLRLPTGVPVPPLSRRRQGTRSSMPRRVASLSTDPGQSVDDQLADGAEVIGTADIGSPISASSAPLVCTVGHGAGIPCLPSAFRETGRPRGERLSVTSPASCAEVRCSRTA
jgi:hypothetical protein